MELIVIKLDLEYLDLEDRELICMLPKRRKEKFDRYRFEKDKKLCLYSYLLAVMMIMKNGTQITRMPDFLIGMHGKPFISNERCRFNISHSGLTIACGCSRGSELGVDVEELKKPYASVMHKCFTDEEIFAFGALSSGERNDFFYRTWTRKEAYLKYCGTGIDRKLNTINTLSHSGEYKYHTFGNKDFVCSVCSDASEPINYETSDEYSLREYWKNYREVIAYEL